MKWTENHFAAVGKLKVSSSGKHKCYSAVSEGIWYNWSDGGSTEVFM